MFFMNEAHRINYQNLLKHWENRLPSVEYDVACYILAAPEILKRVHTDDLEHPFEWAWEWYIDEEDNEKKRRKSNALYYMDMPYEKLVLAGNHMYNGDSFRLNEGLEHWKEEHFQVFIQACKIRGDF